jgi:tRNA-dihydrouridine synthase A
MREAIQNNPTPATTRDTSPWRFCAAPMMDWSDRHCRYFWRLLSKNALLYTEMVTTGALIHGDRERFLRYNADEHPLALQVGGSNPRDLAECARMAEDWGYDEINLNCGCPSDRVQQGMIGACLMGEPALVADCVSAMISACKIPVTVKHRIGIDDMDDYEAMRDFVRQIAQAGCDTFIVHARKAWLKGLSPKENREVPPLQYERVYQLKQEFPDLNIVINGGITTLEQCQELLTKVDGVMLGREVYHNPYLLAGVDQTLFGDSSPIPSRHEILDEFIAYCERNLPETGRLHPMARHILGLFLGQPGARAFRRHISTFGVKAGAGTEVLRQAGALCAARQD